MAESLDINGTAPAMQMSNVEQTGDKLQLIAEDQSSHANGPEIPASPGGSTESRSEISPLQLEGMEATKSRKKTQEGLKIIIISSVSFSVSVTVALVLTIFLGPPAVPEHGAVACDVQVCSDLGVRTLRQGGSAVDAAVTALLCVGVVNPHHSGMGGGAFMLIRNHKKNKSDVINALEVAPSGASPDKYNGNRTLIEKGPLSVGVPAELRGLQAAHDQFGKLSWKAVVQPVADLARTGFNVTGSLASAIQTSIDAHVGEDAALRDMFYRAGSPLQEGDFMQRPDLAQVLQDIADDGVDAFYEGKYGQEILDATAGVLDGTDLRSYNVSRLDTLKRQFRNMTVETMPAPGGGPFVLFILHVLQNYTLSLSNQTDPLYYHRLIETVKFMNAERNRFGDPNKIPGMENATDLITSLEYASSIKSRIHDNQTQQQDYYLHDGAFVQNFGTAHVSVIGPNEDFVSATSSINMHFGSHVVTPSGLILNNQLANFDIPNTGASRPDNMNNYIEPGKRPMSSMSPTFVHKFGKPCAPRVAIGATNGSRIIAGVAEVLLNILAFNQNITSAIEGPRINDPLIPDVVEYDYNIKQGILDDLRQKGHTVADDHMTMNLVHAVAKINETVLAHADSREAGSGQSIY